MTRYPSPDGRFVVVTVAYEMRMSHWVEAPYLYRTGEEDPLLNVSVNDWSADTIEWAEDSRSVTLSVRRYPGNGDSVSLTLFPEDETATMTTEGGIQRTASFDKISSVLEEIYRLTRRR